MTAWRELFAKNCAGMSAVYRGNESARPSMDALGAQKKAWERVVEVDEMLMKFITANP